MHTLVLYISMSTAQVSQVSDIDAGEIHRRTADFPPSIWGDRFIYYDPEQTEMDGASRLQEIEELKEHVRNELSGLASHSLSRQLDLIDAMERLGVGYHFESEIHEVLQNLYNTFNEYSSSSASSDDLYTAALGFRLLRQHGHRVPCGTIFNVFKEEDAGKYRFKEFLASDVSGMLNLYEAANVRFHGEEEEDDTDESINFIAARLRSMVATQTSLTSPQKEKVMRALHKPLHKRVPKIESRFYISIYGDDASHSQALLKLAKLDFNLLQSLHMREISQLSRWAKGLDFTTKLPFVRDRMVEGYFWTLGMVYEPEYSLSRIIIAKTIYILTAVDDIYDAYGTIEELTLFAEACERWDASCTDQLPEYMQYLYKLFLDFFDEVEEEVSRKGWSSYRVDYTKETMKRVVRASFNEAKWINDKRIPTMEEYLRAGLVIAGAGTITVMLLVALDCTVPKETFDWVLSRPKFITSSEFHFRILDDIHTHKFEQERGHDISSVEIYMKQYGVSEREAYEGLRKLVSDAWKDVNEEWLRLTAASTGGGDDHDLDLPKPVLNFILNYPRIIYLLYEKDDFFTRVGKEMKAYVEALLIDPVPV